MKAILILILFTFSHSLMAGPQSDYCKEFSEVCYQGEKIVFTPDPKNIDDFTKKNACESGKADLKKCTFGDKDMVPCYRAHYKICEFCKDESTIAVNLKMDDDEWRDHCQSVEDTPKGCKKLVMSPARFRNVKGRMLAQLKKVETSFNDLVSYIQRADISTADFREKLPPFTKAVSTAIFGRGGVNERLDKFGYSTSVADFRSTSSAQREFWKNQVLPSLSSISSENDKIAATTNLNQIKSKFKNIHDTIDRDFSYKPECTKDGPIKKEKAPATAPFDKSDSMDGRDGGDGGKGHDGKSGA